MTPEHADIAPRSQASILIVGDYATGTRVRFTGSGDLYQTQPDGSVRRHFAEAVARTQRERREAKRAARRLKAREKRNTR